MGVGHLDAMSWRGERGTQSEDGDDCGDCGRQHYARGVVRVGQHECLERGERRGFWGVECDTARCEYGAGQPVQQLEDRAKRVRTKLLAVGYVSTGEDGWRDVFKPPRSDICGASSIEHERRLVVWSWVGEQRCSGKHGRYWVPEHDNVWRERGAGHGERRG